MRIGLGAKGIAQRAKGKPSDDRRQTTEGKEQREKGIDVAGG